MASKDEKNLARVMDTIAKMDEPQRSLVRRVHEAIVAAAPTLKPRIWYGMPAYALSASTPALGAAHWGPAQSAAWSDGRNRAARRPGI